MTPPQPLPKYQLCRMVLVNAGTNQRVPSARITAIDPRGGAAVLGDNGVGKTTTLRILPLFFGHPPSQIVTAGHGQDAMIRFILPTEASAIAFEYQRGNDTEHDLRLAVLRRRADDPDVPFYRFYRSGFRKDLFVGEGRFLSDLETEAKAAALGIRTTGRLSLADYRSVILDVPSLSKDRMKLRGLALDWSFGPRPLGNLDRVVAAMVKKHIDFNDIIQIAVGLVQQDLGQGGERARLTFKQGRAPIELWLRNRDACLDARRLAPQVSELEASVRDYRTAEARWNACAADVAALTQARERESEKLALDLTDLNAAGVVEANAEKSRAQELEHAASAAASASRAARSAYQKQQDSADHFDSESATLWEQKIAELPSLRERVRQAEKQIEAAESKQSDASHTYEQLKSEARIRSAEEHRALEGLKVQHRTRQIESIRQIGAAQNAATDRCDSDFSERRRQLDEEMSRLQMRLGVCKTRRDNPAASDEARREEREAEQGLRQHWEQMSRMQQASHAAQSELQAATQEFYRHENAARDAKTHLEAAKAEQDRARAQLDPPEGTLLAALRSSATSDWKRNLAKVIDERLLARNDLDPTYADDVAATLYGWEVNTGVIAVPHWADDALARQAVDIAQERVTVAEAQVTERVQARAQQGSLRDEAKAKSKIADAQLAIVQNQTDEREARSATAKQRVQRELAEAAQQASGEVASTEDAIRAVRNQQRLLQDERGSARTAIQQVYDTQRSEAERLCGDAIAAVDKSADELRRALEGRLRDLEAQLDEHLSQAGVDVKRLGVLRTEAQRLREDVRKREDQRALVSSWQRWLREGGRTKLGSLKSDAEHAAAAERAAAGRLAQFAAQTADRARAHEQRVFALTRQCKAIADDLEDLHELAAQFNGNEVAANGESALNPATSVNDLRMRVRGLSSDLDRLESKVRMRTTNLRQALTAKPSNVRELIEAGLAQQSDDDACRRAEALADCYRQIDPQVVRDVNLTLRTLLANIDAFHKAIQSFEREVARFNRRLQEGLNEVKYFERLKDLRLDVVTNFEDLGFYKRLARMGQVARRQAVEGDLGTTDELPSDEVARALGDFTSVLGTDGNIEINLFRQITLKGSVSDNGRHKEFKRASELENISSEGLTSLILITLMTALLNTIRGTEPVHVPWVTDEVSKFDPQNFQALMQKLRDNRIDVVTASPELGPAQHMLFAHRYLFEDRGRVREYRALEPGSVAEERAP